ncbi:MAG: 30S ribosomal protein S20 [Anaerolineae bacterium]|nr:30S ribosomal protein S20 [Chloroflexota bacterium]
MANSPSAIKRVRQEATRRARNRATKSRMRTFIRQAQEAIAGGDRNAAAVAVRSAISEIDRAASKGVIHLNNASRNKSRLMARFNRLSD